jgi:hypothetical protein
MLCCAQGGVLRRKKMDAEGDALQVGVPSNSRRGDCVRQVLRTMGMLLCATLED